MATEPVFGSVRINENSEIAAVELKTECKTDVPSDTVARIIDVSAFCGGADFTDGDKIKVSGTVIFNVVYASTDGNVRKYECAQEFSQEFAEDSVGKTFIPRVKTEKTAADVSGTRLSVYAIIAVGGKIYSYKEIPCLSGGENVVADSEEKTVVKSLGIKRAAFPVEDEINLPYEVAEVLSQRANAVIADVQCGVGSIIIDGEAVFSALLLQNSENGDIIKEEKIIPFRYELECDEAMPSNTATAEVFIKSVRSDVSVDTESGKSTANVIIAVSVIGEAIAEETVNIATDAFSVTDNVNLTFAQAEYTLPCGIKTVRKSVSGRCPVSFPSGAVIAAVKDENFETVSVKTEKGLYVQGVYSLKAVYKDADGKFGSLTLETPVEFNDDLPKSDNTAITVTAVSGKVRQVSDSEAEISGEIIVSAKCGRSYKFRFVSGLESAGEKSVIDAAISVYIPLDGEKLFSLAKRLNVHPETLVATNKDLTFPLTGKERIVIYRKM